MSRESSGNGASKRMLAIQVGILWQKLSLREDDSDRSRRAHEMVKFEDFDHENVGFWLVQD